MQTQAVVKTADSSAVEFVPFGAKDSIKLSVSIIQKLIAVKTKSGKTCSEGDAMKFLMMCRSRRLNPFEGDAYLIGFDGKDGPQFSLVTAHQAFLKRAETHPEFNGFQSGLVVSPAVECSVCEGKGIRGESICPVCGGRGKSDEIEGDILPESAKLVGAWCTVHFKDRKFPMKKRVALKTYRKPFGLWNDAPEMMIVKCFDEQTEVLTTRGFEKFATAEGRILEVTPHGLNPTDAVPFYQPYTGPMIVWNPRHGNFSVTPNHDMPISLNGGAEKKMEAGDLLKLRHDDRAMMPLTFRHDLPDFGIEDDTIRLAAAYVADGSDNSNGPGFSIAVSRPRKVRFLKKLKRYLSFSKKQEAGDTAIMAGSGRVLTTKSDKTAFYYSRTKELTELAGRKKLINHETLLKLSQRQAKLFVDTWMFFDGHRHPTMFEGRIYMSRPSHVHAFELAAIQAGYSINKPTVKNAEGNQPNYMMSITSKASVRLYKLRLAQSPNAGGVWCVKVPSGKIVVRRKGFSAVINNCSEADALRSAFPQLLGGMVLREEMSPIDIQVDAKLEAVRPSPSLIAPTEPASEPASEPTDVSPESEPEPESAPTQERKAVPTPAPAPARKAGKPSVEDAIKLSELCAEAEIPEERLCRYFTNSYGVSPCDNLREVFELAPTRITSVLANWQSVLPILKEMEG